MNIKGGKEATFQVDTAATCDFIKLRVPAGARYVNKEAYEEKETSAQGWEFCNTEICQSMFCATFQYKNAEEIQRVKLLGTS